jgi:hypothetical protein
LQLILGKIFTEEQNEQFSLPLQSWLAVSEVSCEEFELVPRSHDQNPQTISHCYLSNMSAADVLVAKDL